MNIYQQLRPRKARCKTGCMSCRLRKKKCDESKPSCNSCKRLGLLCSYPASAEFAWRRRMGLSSATDRQKAGASCDREARSPARKRDSPMANAQGAAFTGSTGSIDLKASGFFYTSLNPGSSLGVPGATAATSPLLNLYITKIVPHLLCAPKNFVNPFLHDVVPMAFEDPLIMNAVLALGGSVLGVRPATTKDDERFVLQCYGQAIRDLKLGLTAWSVVSSGRWETLRLFLTVLLLCHYEAVCGNKSGHFFLHLRAARVFATSLYAARDGPWSTLVGVLLENHAWFELSSSLRLTPDDADIEAASRIVIPRLPALSELSTFGVIFCEAAEIFQLAPEICELARRRKVELTGRNTDLGCAETFERLKSAITNWRGTTTNKGQSENTRAAGGNDDGDTMYAQGRIAAGMVSQNALLLFLFSSYLQDRNADEEYLRAVSQPLVDAMVEVLPVLNQTAFVNTTFWPLIVTASFATTEEQQRTIAGYFPPVLPIVVRALEVLRWVWDNQGMAFGLSGLARVIQLHGTSYCFG
ncbi:fungal-specific transcription factor domain-containing protein [Aspergillus desertorum]